jgi:hypothetical protein
MTAIPPCTGFRAAPICLLVTIFLTLLPGDVRAQGLPVEMGSQVPIWIWFFGTIVLGGAMAYGIFRNRTSTKAEKDLTERATAELYRREESDRVKSGSV